MNIIVTGGAGFIGGNFMHYMVNKYAEDTIILKIKARHISGEVEIEIKGQRRMTTQKDESLMKLYKIQKDEIKIMKEIEKFIKEHEQDDNEIINKIKELSLQNEI